MIKTIPQIPTERPSDDFVLSTYQHLATMFSPRNAEYSILRKVFDGDFVGAQQTKALGDAQFQERVKLIYNICNATVRRYMDQLSAPPRIECIPRGWEPKDLEMADKQTKFLEYVYESNGFDKLLMQAGFYQSLLDNAVWHVRPNPSGHCKIKLELGVPDFYYPVVCSDDWNDVRGVIYAFRKFTPGAWQQDAMKAPSAQQLGQNTDVCIEWWDRTYYMRYENGRCITQIKHDLGIIPWHKAENIPIPHRFRGQGDVDQAIGLNEYLNMLMSDMADMINYAANPIAVVRGTKVGGVNLPFAPRAVWELERDAQVGFLQWTGAPPSVEAQLIRSIQAIEDTTGVSSPAFGREIPSGTSGSAVRSLMAGFNTRLGTKQTLMGGALVRANQDICRMAERLFPNWEVPVVGELQSDEMEPVVEPGAMAPYGETPRPPKVKRRKGSKVQYTVKPKEFDGWYKNRMIFPPTDPTASYFQEMDKFAKGIQSKETTMRNMGITNIYDEQARIKAERLEEAEHANNLGLAQQGQFVSPEQQAATQSQDQAGLEQLIASLKPVMGGGDKALEQRKAKRDAASAAAKAHGTGEVEGPTAPQLQLPGPGATPGNDEPTNISDVMVALRRAANVSGRAALTGDIVKNSASPRFTIALENPQDANAIKIALGPLASKADFTVADFTKPLPADSAEFTDPSKAGSKKKVAEARKLDQLLRVVVLGVEKTNNDAVILTVGVSDGKSVLPIAKTNAQRRITAEQGELITIHIDGISQKDGKFGLVNPTVVKSPSAISAPHSTADLIKMFERAK